MVRRVGALPDPKVPAYTSVDGRIGWKVRHDLELSFTVENLFDKEHAEYVDANPTINFEPGEFGRSVFFKMFLVLFYGSSTNNT